MREPQTDRGDRRATDVDTVLANARWERTIRAALIDQFRDLQNNPAKSAALYPDAPAFATRFYNEFADSALSELQLAAALSSVAAVEAVLQESFRNLESSGVLLQSVIDFRDIVIARTDGRLSCENLIELFEMQYAGDTALIQAFRVFKGYLKLRHWIAHGRYWQLKMGVQQLNTRILHELCADIAASL